MSAPVTLTPAQRALVEALAAALAPPPPVEPPPRYRQLAAEAERLGMSTSRLRVWCLSHAVAVHVDDHKTAWVSPDEIARAVEGLPLARPAPSRRPAALEDPEARAMFETIKANARPGTRRPRR